MIARVIIETPSADSRFPRLSNCRDAGGRSTRMCHDPAAGKVEHVDRFRAAIRFGCLKAGLSRRDHRQNRKSAEKRLETRLDRSHDRIVALPEFVDDAVDVDLIDARQSPELLIRGK